MSDAAVRDGVDGWMENRIFDEIRVGDTAAARRRLAAADIRLFALLSGDNRGADGVNADDPAAGDAVIAHGLWSATVIAGVIGTQLPGPGTVHRSQTLRYLSPVRVGDTLDVSVTVTLRNSDDNSLRLDCRCINQEGHTVIEGEAEVIAPTQRIRQRRGSLPQVRVVSGDDGSRRLLDHARSLQRLRTAVIHPCDEASLLGALDAHAAGLIEPVLVGPAERIHAVAEAAGADLTGIAIDDVPHSHAAAARGAVLAAGAQVQALMKGSLHTDELLAAVLSRDSGLRTERRVSHCFLMHTPSYPRPFIITDAAINIDPSLDEKADIIRNAIDLAHAIGVPRPRVAILAAVETVSARMPATLDAAALCKMADRGQISGALLDGPLAFDNAVSAAAARTKGIESAVAGRADILVVPDLESGNMLAKQLEHMGDATSAGIVLGARVPMMLSSRADSRGARLAACALAVVLAEHYRSAPP